MPPLTVPYAPSGYYTPNGRLVDLIRAQGQDAARAAEMRGENSARLWAGVGNSIQSGVNSVLQAQREAPRIALENLQVKEATKQISEGDQLKAIIRKTPKVDLGDGTIGYDIPTISDAVTAAGGDPSVVQQHLGPLNQSFQQVQSTKLAAVKQGAISLKAAGDDPELAHDLLDMIEKNHVYPASQIAHFRSMIQADPANVAKLTASIIGPPKIENAAPGSMARNVDTGQVVAGSQVPDPKAEADAKVAAARVAETERHNLAVEAIQKQTQGREAAQAAETARHNREVEKANNPLAALTGGQGGANVAAPPPNVNGEDFLKSIPRNVGAQVKALAEGRMQFPAGFALKSPYWQSMLQMVSQYDPNFDAINYNSRSKTRQDFTSGSSAKQVNAINTVIGHLDNLSAATDALNNSDIPLFNKIANTVSKATGSPKVTNFNTVKKAVADEVTRVWRQAGGSVEDIKTAQENLDAAGSPQQLHQAIATYGDLLESKLEAFQNQYTQGLGTNDIKMLTPTAAATLEHLRQKTTGTAPAATGPKIGEVRTANGETRKWDGSAWQLVKP